MTTMYGEVLALLVLSVLCWDGQAGKKIDKMGDEGAERNCL
jgi:hypothetical protein